MTLREMIDAYPEKFYAGQTWFDGEAFMDTEVERFDLPVQVDGLCGCGEWHQTSYTAADLVWLWLNEDMTEFHDRYLWTSDTDSQGQRVYVGQNGKGLEIHRHLHLTDRWGVPV